MPSNNSLHPPHSLPPADGTSLVGEITDSYKLQPGIAPETPTTPLHTLFSRSINSDDFHDVLLTLTAEGIVQQVNQACKQVFGLAPEQLQGTSYLAIVCHEEKELVQDFFSSLSVNKTAQDMVQRSIHCDGTLRHISWSAFWVEEENLVVAICRDVTALKEAQKKQLATEQLLQALIENSFDLLALIDEEGNYVYVSEAFYNTFEYNARVLQGYTASELIGTNCFGYMHPEDLPWLLEQYKNLFNGEKKLHVPPFRFRNASGVYRWTEAIVTNQLQNPDVKAIVVSARDIHQQVEAEQKLKEMQLLEALMEGEEKERSRIARDLHDEIAGMIAAAKMHVEILAGKTPEVTDKKEYHQVTALLEKAALQVRRTSHNLMPEIVLENGLDSALERYCKSISNDFLTVDYFSLGTINRHSPAFELSLYRIAQELINNIIKHSGASEAIVQISQRNHLLSLTIEDNGKGFHPDLQKSGTGIYSVRQRVRAMNGQLEINSSPGRGTSVYLEFENV
ncbi:MAG TPA: PAS domain S-box protein [Flavisolibacter sp.]|jgi:PAS domain S-box-containing protein|nr:PAS domain S-box protein [Flavisolibacter sp.]